MGFDVRLTRKELLASTLALAAGAALPGSAAAFVQPADAPDGLTEADLAGFARVAALPFTAEQLKALVPTVNGEVPQHRALRTPPIPYAVEPQLPFRPWGRQPAPGREVSVRPGGVSRPRLPDDDADLAFLTVRELGALLRAKLISSRELTDFFLARLERWGDRLLCVVTLTPDLARQQARRADAELGRGFVRGPLHGVPYGAKDILATKGIPTTWGAEPFRDQVFDEDAAVIERLRDAGAVLCAKTSVGALAMGDVWFRGMTRNPWNPERGSSGSSAGSCSAVAAGLLPFAIGSETLGSIVSPCLECRTTGLRPTYGRVSRHGAMAVSWTFDKIGPICRDAQDTALVTAALVGHDPRDPSSVDRPFRWRQERQLRGLKIGYIGDDTDAEHLAALRKAGAEPERVRFSPPNNALQTVLVVEAAAAFDDLTLSGRVDEIKESAWPAIYRAARFVPAVEYLQVQRARAQIARSFEAEFGEYDLVVAEERSLTTLLTTNATGHPQLIVPFGVNPEGLGRSVSFVGRLYDEPTLIRVADALQSVTDHHHQHPDMTKV